MPTEKYIIYFEGDKVKTVYTRREVDLWELIAQSMGFKFDVEEISLI